MRQEVEGGVERTCDPRSAVVDALELGGRVDNVAGGKNVDPRGDVLAIVITT